MRRRVRWGRGSGRQTWRRLLQCSLLGGELVDPVSGEESCFVVNFGCMVERLQVSGLIETVDKLVVCRRAGFG